MTDYSMPERVTPHLRRLIAAGNPAIEAQYLQVPVTSQPVGRYTDLDPLREEALYSAGSGLIHKFGNRLLWKVTYRCAAHCQFCTRYRQIGSPEGDLSDENIAAGLDYLRAHEHIDDVILSGGDPLFVPSITTKILNALSTLDSVRVIRLGTRLPVQSPDSLSSPSLQALIALLGEVNMKKRTYVLIHLNHPAELTAAVDAALRQLAQAGLTLLSQSVFLKGINDNSDTLAVLFRELFYRGVIPYYIYRCDAVRGLERFVCDIETERRIMTQLTARLSGIAVPAYVIDVSGKGKLPVPLHFWKGTAMDSCTDFDGNEISF